MSARTSSDKATLLSPLISLNRFNSWDTNIRPWRTHFVIKCNFPNNTCNSCLLVDYFTNHISTSLLISRNRSGITSITMLTVSKNIPKNVMRTAGSHAFEWDSSNPNVLSKWPMYLIASCTCWGTSAPPVIQVVQHHHSISTTDVAYISGLLTSNPCWPETHG